ncbi:hypothetical protein QBC38DRAFT_549240 [Podospora fimiseda]|uniref:Dehydrogenase n=1 Tax=Podospora fimiseda TaxID=252190 RepID=A0AAN6YR90_9PEZI|nr:hypothetical protein QBC38DRAFT_549240 [Podospora fimiseda]
MAMWQHIITANLTAPVAFASAVLPSMLDRRTGTIISIGNRNATLDIPFMSAYSVAKPGLLKFHQKLEREIGGRGVFNYYLQPGNVATDILARAGTVDQFNLEYNEKLRDCKELIAKVPKIKAEVVGMCTEQTLQVED